MDSTTSTLLLVLIAAIGIWYKFYLSYISRGRIKLLGVFQVKLDSNGKVPAKPKRVLDLTVNNPGSEQISIMDWGMILRNDNFKREIVSLHYPGPEKLPMGIQHNDPKFFQYEINNDEYDKFLYSFVVDSEGKKYKLRKRKFKIQIVPNIHYRKPGKLWIR